MRARLKKKVLVLGLVGLAGLILASMYLWRKEAYELNRNVRLAWMRLLRYRQLSLHRGCAYRIQFEKDYYVVSFKHPDQGEAWRTDETFAYVDRVEVASPGFTVVFDHGHLVSCYVGKEGQKLKPALVLYFFHPKKPERRRGILFTSEGIMRAL